MSDARQSIEAARAVPHSPAVLDQAETLLRRAEAEIEAGAHSEARRDARQAKELARKARGGVPDTQH